MKNLKDFQENRVETSMIFGGVDGGKKDTRGTKRNADKDFATKRHSHCPDTNTVRYTDGGYIYDETVKPGDC